MKDAELSTALNFYNKEFKGEVRCLKDLKLFKEIIISIHKIVESILVLE